MFPPYHGSPSPPSSRMLLAQHTSHRKPGSEVMPAVWHTQCAITPGWPQRGQSAARVFSTLPRETALRLGAHSPHKSWRSRPGPQTEDREGCACLCESTDLLHHAASLFKHRKDINTSELKANPVLQQRSSFWFPCPCQSISSVAHLCPTLCDSCPLTLNLLRSNIFLPINIHGIKKSTARKCTLISKNQIRSSSTSWVWSWTPRLAKTAKYLRCHFHLSI